MSTSDIQIALHQEKRGREMIMRAAHTLNCALPHGTVVSFKFGSMTKPASATIIWCGEMCGSLTVKLRNHSTGKVRRVPAESIIRAL